MPWDSVPQAPPDTGKKRRNLLIVFLATIGLLALVFGLGAALAESDYDACKRRATEVLQEYLDADTFGEALKVTEEYGEEERFREALPECTDISKKEDEEIQYELEPLINKVDAHLEQLMLDAVLED